MRAKTSIIELLAVGLGLIAGLALSLLDRHAPTVVDVMLRGERAALYGTLASVFAALLGFCITALSIFSGSVTNPRLKLANAIGYASQVRRLLVLAIATSGLGALAAIVALLFDRDVTPNIGLSCLVLGLGVSTAAGTAACVWALNHVVDALTHQPDEGAPNA